MRAKHEVLWRAKTENLVEDLEASKLAIHNLMQENLSLQVTIQQNQEESQRIQEEAKVKLEAKIHQLQSQNESLIKQPQIVKLQRENASMTQENYKLRHQVKVKHYFWTHFERLFKYLLLGSARAIKRCTRSNFQSTSIDNSPGI